MGEKTYSSKDVSIIAGNEKLNGDFKTEPNKMEKFSEIISKYLGRLCSNAINKAAEDDVYFEFNDEGEKMFKKYFKMAVMEDEDNG